LAFKELDPIPQFKATAKLGSYLERVSRSWPGRIGLNRKPGKLSSICWEIPRGV
jgi:hypothetical protein